MNIIRELKEISFFRSLGEKELILLSSLAHKRKFSKDEILFYEKEKPKYLTLLTKGTLKVYKTDNKNNEIVMHRFKAKSLVAEMAVLEGIDYPASAVFESDGEVLELDFDKFKNNFLTNPDIALSFFKSLSRKIKNLEDVIALNVVLDATSRVAKYLCENEEALSMKHTELSKHLHMTPETLSRVFKKFIKLGFLEKSAYEYKIVDRTSLTVLYE